MGLKRRGLRELAIAVLSATVGLGALVILELVLHATMSSRQFGGPLHEVVHDWRFDCPGAWILLGMLSAALGYPVRALLALRRHDSAASATAGELGILATLGATSSAVFAASAIVRAYAGRMTSPSDAAERTWFTALQLERETALWSIVGAGLALLAALWGSVGIAWARRESRGSAAKIASIVGVTGVVAVTGVSLLRWWLVVARIAYNEEWMEPERRYELIVSTGDPLIHGRHALIFVAAIAAVALLIAARRARSRPGASREMIVGAGLFVLGLGAFAFTRGEAYDALHPLPLWETKCTTTFSEATVASSPRGDSCILGAQEGPHALLVDGAWSIDGVRTATAADFGDRLASQKKLWTQVMPGKPFPGLLMAEIPAETPMSVVRPFLQAAREVGYPDLYLLEGLPPRTFATRTRGEIAYRPRLCFVMATQADAIPTTGTWGDWASSLAPR